MRLLKTLTVFLFVLILSITTLSLKVPTYISFQGKLSNYSSGNPYYPASLRINITNQSQLSQVEWGPYIFNNVADEQGVFDIILGKSNQLNLTPGWNYQLVVEVDIGSETFESPDIVFGDLNPSGDSILITGGGPASAAQLVMADNLTSVQEHDHSGGGKGVSILGPSSGWLNVSDKLYVATGISLGGNYITTWPGGGGGSAAWIAIGDILNLNNSVATIVNISYAIGTEINVSRVLNLLSTTNYLRDPSFASCGKLYTDSNGLIKCGIDSEGAVQPNIDASNITTGLISLARLPTNLNISEQGWVNYTALRDCSEGQILIWTNSEWMCINNNSIGQTTAAYFGENTTLWQKINGVITSNITISNVNVTGNLEVAKNISLYTKNVMCFGNSCNACIYWNGTHLIQESPCTAQ